MVGDGSPCSAGLHATPASAGRDHENAAARGGPKEAKLYARIITFKIGPMRGRACCLQRRYPGWAEEYRWAGRGRIRPRRGGLAVDINNTVLVVVFFYAIYCSNILQVQRKYQLI